jgi:hypothetical protein
MADGWSILFMSSILAMSSIPPISAPPHASGLQPPAFGLKPAVLIQIDLDSLWAIRRVYGLAETRDDLENDPLYALGLSRFLDLFAERGLRATFFAIGRDAAVPAKAALLRRASDAGHEVANHSQTHLLGIGALPPAELDAEIAHASDAIAAATGERPVGFRAPGYDASPAVLQAVARAGMLYDTSLLPTTIGPLLRAAAGMLRRGHREGRPEEVEGVDGVDLEDRVDSPGAQASEGFPAEAGTTNVRCPGFNRKSPTPGGSESSRPSSFASTPSASSPRPSPGHYGSGPVWRAPRLPYLADLQAPWRVAPPGAAALLELPVAVTARLRLPVHASVAAAAGRHWARHAIGRLARPGMPVVYVFHAVDLVGAEELPRLPSRGPLARLVFGRDAAQRRRFVTEVLDAILDKFAPLTSREFAEAYRSDFSGRSASQPLW